LLTIKNEGYESTSLAGTTLNPAMGNFFLNIWRIPEGGYEEVTVSLT